MEGIAAMNLSTQSNVYCTSQAGGDFKLVHQTLVQKHQEPFGDIDYVLPNARWFSMRTSLYIFEDNEAAIQHLSERQKSYNASCVTHTSCWFGLTLWLHQSRLRSNTSTQHSNLQTFSQKYHTGDRWTQPTLLVNIMARHHIDSKQFVSLFCSCEPLIFQHEWTCQRIFRYMG